MSTDDLKRQWRTPSWFFLLKPIIEEWYQRTQKSFCLVFDPKGHGLLFEPYFVTGALESIFIRTTWSAW